MTWSSSQVLMCSVCIVDTRPDAEQVRPAATVLQGYAVCEEHADVIGFSRSAVLRIHRQWAEEKREAEIKEKTTT